MNATLGPFGLHLILMADIGDASDLPVFPRLLHSIDQGETNVVQWFVRKRLGWGGGASGMSTMMDAAAGATPARLAMIAEQRTKSRFGDVVNFPLLEVAALWNPPALPADYRSPVVSGVRTLRNDRQARWLSRSRCKALRSAARHGRTRRAAR